MEINKFKSAAAMATIGLSGLMATNAMANDFDTNQIAYNNLGTVQQHVEQVQSMDFNNIVLEAKNSTNEIEHPELKSSTIEKPAPSPYDSNEPELSSLGGDEPAPSPYDSNEPELSSLGGDEPAPSPYDSNDLELSSLGSDEPAPSPYDSNEPELSSLGGDNDPPLENDESGVDLTEGTDLEAQIEGISGEQEQVESCDREANSPKMLARIGGWVLKGTAFVLTVKSAGTAAIPAHMLNTAGDALLMNGCDKFDVEEEVYKLGKKVLSSTAGNAGIVVEVVADYAKSKYDKAQAEKEAEHERIPEAPVVTTSDVEVPQVLEPVKFEQEEPVIGIKINKQMMDDVKVMSDEIKNRVSDNNKLKM